MKSASLHWTAQKRATLKSTWLLLACLLVGFISIPEAYALDCPATFADVPGERVQLKACDSDLGDSSADDNAVFQLPGPATVSVGDLLIVNLVIDGNNTTLNPPAGWTELQTRLSGNDMSSNVWYRVATIADVAKPTYTFGWAGGNERNVGYLLQFTGTGAISGIPGSGFEFNSATEGNGDATPDSPSVTSISPFNLILRMANVDRQVLDTGLQGPSAAWPAEGNLAIDPYFDVLQLETTGGGQGQGTTAAYGYLDVPGATLTEFIPISSAEGSHHRTMAIEPYEFRYFLEDTSGAGPTQSSVCSVKQVTLRVTDSAGNVVPTFTGTVTLSTSTGNGNWIKTGTATDAEGTLIDTPGDDDGIATYQFVANDAGEMILNYENTNIEVVNFDVTFGNWSESTTASYTSPNLTITSCVPSAVASACVPNNTTNNTNLTIGGLSANPLNRGRMVLMAIGLEGSAFSSAVTFDGAPMTLIYREFNPNGAQNVNELWGILDADLPTVAGSYNGSFTNADGGPTMCMVYLEGVQQEFPGPSSGATAADPINGSQDEGVQDAVTSITTAADNAFVLSVIGNGSGGTSYPPASSAPALTWSNAFTAPDPDGGADFDANFAIKATAGPLTVTESWPSGNTLRHTHVVSSFRPLQQIVTPTEIRLSHSTQSDVCSLEAVTISITDGSGNVDTSFTGTITVTTSALAGAWTVSSATNALVDNGGGSVDYTFDAADNGQIVLFYQLPTVNGAVDFDVTTTTPGITSPAGAFDPILDIASCTVDIQVTDGTAELCEAGESVTYTIRDRFGAIATDYAGILILTNSTSSNGDYSPVGENGTFVNGASGDGIANYTFDAADNGVLTVTFTDDIAETASLNASSAGITLDGGSNADIVFNACEFRIAYTDADAGLTDVCSVEQVRIGLYNSGGSVVTGYTGTVNLSTTTGNGTWSDPGGLALGTLTDPVGEDGSATYTFVAGDNGEVTLDFIDLTNETTNINVTDGTTTDPADNMDPNDPDLLVDLCTFQFSLDGGATFDDALSDACSVQQITLTLVDRLGGNPEVNYTGTVNLSTSTVNGNWSGGGSGTLIDTPGDNDGIATYQFAPADGNTVTLDFTDLQAELVNFNAVDGVIVESGLADPDLDVQSCLPDIDNFSCVAGGSPLSTAVTIDAQETNPALRGRLVVVATALEGDGDVTSVTFNGVAMTQIFDNRLDDGTFDNATELWGMLDADLPAAAGAYNASVTHTDNDNIGMCAFYVTDVEQVIPTTNVPDFSGQVNGTQQASPPTATTSTAVTTTENNALILSIVSNGTGNDYNDISPEPPITRLFNGPDPSSAAFAGSSGRAPTAATITIDETAAVVPNRYTHIVAAFNPLISGPPAATGYVPVELFETYSGNLSYRAVGNTFRNAANPSSCSFNTTSSATLTMPDEVVPAGFDSTVVAAYLYWFASGDDALGQSDANVTLTNPALVATPLTADEVFLIDNIGGGANLDYFGAYKDVTALISGNGTYTLSDLAIQNGAPWNLTQACAGGWALIVVYDNPFEQFRVVNLFHGFQPFQNSNFTLVPRNFRMATPSDIEDLPNGQVTHITVEGDETLSNGDESLQIQDAPGSATYTPLVTYHNPLQAEFNGTVTRPLYSLVDVDPGPGVTQYYLFDSSQGAGGYEIDFPGPDVGDEVPGPPDPDEFDEIGASWGTDIDTHYVSGDGNTGDGDDDVLNLFALAEAEEITTRYSAGQDLVILISEVISITNAPIADIEVFKNEVGTFKVDGTGTYEFVVTNNGNGATSFGSATGEITIADTLPAGMTFAAAGDVSGDGWVCSVTLDPGAFTCTFDIATDWTLPRGASVAGELGETAPGSGIGESLPTLTATVQIGDTSFFPNQNNSAKNVARMVFTGGNCSVFADGISPNPSDCDPSPEYDDVNNLQGGTVDINTLEDKSSENNNIDSVTTNVVGVLTDLAVNKFVNGVLEAGSGVGAGQYTIRVTNLGPDTTTASFTITDNDPPAITFVSVVADPDWNCTTITPVLSCAYIGAGLAPAASKDLLLNVTVDGADGDLVTNTVSVAPGPFNFDSNSGNDSDTDVTSIVAAPVGATERFLLSVSTALGAGGPTDLDGLDSFDDQDLVLYDPVLDQATLFFDHSASGFGVDDVNALHLLPNGQIVISANGSSTIGSNGVSFDEGDLVRYDPILGTATLIFDGSAVFTDAGENIDAVYVLDNGNLVISTTGDADIGGTSFDKSDLVEYDIGAGTASILVDGSDADVFGSPDLTQVDAAYIRVDPADATATIDTYAVSTDDVTANIGAGGSPPGGTNFTRDDVAQLDRTANESEALFFGNIPLGVFTDDGTGSPDPGMRLDGLHIIEDGYFGHFAVTQSQAGTTCAAGKITITKHQGLTHDVDTDYFGAVRLSTSSGTGAWGLDTAMGTLIDADPTDGEAIYVFVPGDNGDATLSLSIDTVTSDVNVDVTNGIVSELGSEDPDFDFNNVVTVVTYRDEFTAAAFGNNDGSTGWLGDWFEIDDADGVNGGDSGAGVGAGNVRISGGELSLTSNPATNATGRDPSLARSADLGLFTVTEAVYLEFDYRYAFLNVSDSIVVEISDDAGSNWTAFPAYTGLSGTAGPIAESLNVSTLGGTIDDFTGTLSVRFRIDSGYTTASTFFFDDVELRTGTTDCGIGFIDHYEITFLSPGIQCLGTDVTIVGHDTNHFPSAPGNGEVMTLSAIDQGSLTGKGTWASVLSGTGVLADIGVQGALANTDGIGTYTWFGTETTAVLRFNYTNLATDPEVVNFNLGGSFSENVLEDPDLSMRRAGLRFFDETNQLPGIPTQISGKPSNQYATDSIIILQALQTSNDDVSVCEPLFPDTQTVTIEFAAECDDPANCSVTAPAQEFTVNGTPITLDDENGVAGADAYTPISVTFGDQTTSTGVPLVLNYSDAGQIELHARYDIPFNSDPNFPITSEDYIVGNDTLVVRPFGFDIDFSLDRAGGGTLSRANDATGPAFIRAGEDFSATVTARRWQAIDDADLDGNPDPDANLTDNEETPNFGSESTALENDVVLTHVLVEPAVAIGTRDGTLTGGAGFTSFLSGTATETLQYDEVGIITLSAALADNDYLNGGQDVLGNVVNVGRFYPHNFNLTNPVTTAVYNSADPNAFTYMGQEFMTTFVLEARNAANVITQNYIGDFIKLAAADFDNDAIFHAVEDIDTAADNDFTARLESVDGSFSANWDAFGDLAPGTGTIMGDLIFNRENDGLGVDGAEDGPFTLSISTSAQDSDNVAIVLTPGLDIEVDDGITEPGTVIYRRIGDDDIEFRYGRLLVDNAYGPETEDLGVPLRIEYWDGSRFVTNIDDSTTSFLFDISASPPALDFVATSYDADPGTVDPLADGDLNLEEGALVDVTVNLFGGVTGRQQDGDVDDENDPDRPFIISAPDPLAVNGTAGRVMIEFDLNHPSLPFSLDFLSYDWRGGPGEVDDYDEIPEGDNYIDNPRGVVEFGSYRGHDRIINWQEIYIGPSD